MTWVKLDDRAPWHPKLDGLTDAEFGVWVKGLMHCSRHETDGRISKRDLPALGRSSSRRTLFERGLWTKLSDGSAQVARYLSHQRSHEQIEVEREKARNRAAKFRTFARSSREVREPDTDTDTDTEEKRTLTQSVEGKRGEPPAEPIARALFDSIHRDLANTGLTLDTALTRDEAGTLRRVARDLQSLDVTPDEVHRRVANAHASFTAGRVTASAVGRNWSQLVTQHVEPAKPVSLRCPEHEAPIIDGVCQACKYSGNEAV